MIHGIYVITDEELVPGRTHVDITRAALEGGARIIQLRDKYSSDDYLIEAAREIRQLTREVGALFIVNDRLEVALACDADGLHVGQSDRPAREVRSMLKGKILGVSASTLEQAMQAREDGADYLGVGPIFSTSTKIDADPPIGVEKLPVIRAKTDLPIVAIGGINLNNIADIARHGADSASVISAVVCADDMTEATRHLVKAWRIAKADLGV